MTVIPYRKIYLTIAGVLVAASLILFLTWGLKLGIDFTGGSLLEVDFRQGRPQISVLQEKFTPLGLGAINFQPAGDNAMIMRFKNIDEATHQQIVQILNEGFGGSVSDSAATEGASSGVNAAVNAPVNVPVNAPKPGPQVNVTPLSGSLLGGLIDVQPTQVAPTGTVTVGGPAQPDQQQSGVKELRFESIGPVIGKELREKAIYAVIFVLAAIILYVAFAFRKASFPVASWKYGSIAVIALFHDVLLVVGLFVLLGRFLGVEVNGPFVAAILTVLGYSVNDTIVVFDRVRENLIKQDLTFPEIIDSSIRQTLARSINTTLTTLAALVAVYFFGGESIKSFALALIWGIFLGGYSSIFVASPLLVVWYNWDRRKRLG